MVVKEQNVKSRRIRPRGVVADVNVVETSQVVFYWILDKTAIRRTW